MSGIDNLEEFGLVSYQRANATQRQVVEAALRKRVQIPADGRAIVEADILVGSDLVYLPCGYIGSIGALYVPSTDRLIQLGSYTGLADFVWAYHRGITLDAGGAAGENRLTIHAINDRDESVRQLRRIFAGRYYLTEIEPQLDRLPIVIERISLFFSIPTLRQVEASACFEFEIASAIDD